MVALAMRASKAIVAAIGASVSSVPRRMTCSTPPMPPGSFASTSGVAKRKRQPGRLTCSSISRWRQLVVHRHADTAGAHDGVVGDDPVDAVLGADGDALALRQAEGDEARGGLGGEAMHVGPVHAPPSLDIGEAVGNVAGCGVEAVRDGVDSFDGGHVKKV